MFGLAVKAVVASLTCFAPSHSFVLFVKTTARSTSTRSSSRTSSSTATAASTQVFQQRQAALMTFVKPSSCTTTGTTLYIGKGVAKNYRWKEEPNEIEVTVKVPANTRAKDILFKATPTTVDLRYRRQIINSDSSTNETTTVLELLLDGTRPLRGKVGMDGTFWSISDSTSSNPEREVTVMIEKNKRKGEFEVETDWEGVFLEDENDEVISRDYRPQEELNVRDYCKRELGVDIDNIDMTKVDKTMFSTTNMTQNVLQDLKKGGYVREVTQQGDLEFIEERDGSQKEFKQSIPFIDEPTKETAATTPSDNNDKSATTTATDPIDSLTVARLKEILREQNLKVSGTKQELQDRLRNQVQSVVDESD